MDNKKFTVLKTDIQEIIDLIANKKYFLHQHSTESGKTNSSNNR